MNNDAVLTKALNEIARLELLNFRKDVVIEELQNVVYDDKSEKAVIADDGTQTIDQIDGLFYSLADNYHFILD